MVMSTPPPHGYFFPRPTPEAGCRRECSRTGRCSRPSDPPPPRTGYFGVMKDMYSSSIRSRSSGKEIGAVSPRARQCSKRAGAPSSVGAQESRPPRGSPPSGHTHLPSGGVTQHRVLGVAGLPPLDERRVGSSLTMLLVLDGDRGDFGCRRRRAGPFGARRGQRGGGCPGVAGGRTCSACTTASSPEGTRLPPFLDELREGVTSQWRARPDIPVDLPFPLDGHTAGPRALGHRLRDVGGIDVAVGGMVDPRPRGPRSAPAASAPAISAGCHPCRKAHRRSRRWRRKACTRPSASPASGPCAGCRRRRSRGRARSPPSASL